MNLLSKKLADQLEGDEQHQLNNLLGQDQGQRDFASQVEKVWNQSAKYQTEFTPDVEKGLKRFNQHKSPLKVASRTTQQSKSRSLTNFLRIAAAVVLLIGVGWWWQSGGTNVESSEMLVFTASDQSKEVMLPDGSQIVLNRDAELRYSKGLKGDQREVHLTGEAFFDIAKNPDRPFTVHTNAADIKVLGTSFNVRANPGESFTELMVKTGKVDFINNRNPEEHWYANPSDVISFENDSQQMTRSTDRSFNALAWQSGQLVFDGNVLTEVVDQMSRRYRIDFDLSQTESNNCPFTANFIETPLDEALEILTFSLGASWKQSDNGTYQIIGGSCN